MSDWIDRRIFIKNFNDKLKSGDLIRELELVTSAIKRESKKCESISTRVKRNWGI